MKLSFNFFILTTTLLSFGLFSVIESSRILFLLPVASKSHVHVFEPLIRALGERGHEIINLSPVNSSGMPATVKTISAISIDEIFKTMVNPFHQRKQGKLAAMANMSMDYIEDACATVLDNKEVQHVLKTVKFDLVIVDVLLNYCILGILPGLNAPFIYVSTMVAPTYVLDPIGNRMPPSFVPNPFLGYSDRMSFLQRTINLSFNFILDAMGLFMFLPKLENVFQKKLGVTDTILDISKNVSMVLVNSHFSLTYPRAYLPNVVEVGGMHTRSSKPLPKDLEDFVSGAKDGFIFFSLGSIAQGKDMPEECRKVFLNVFSRLKQRVLWKWETDTMEGLPPNVKISKWLPQQDILGHKNIRLFITHGGLLSIQETVYHGVPLLGIPLFADQDLNVMQAEKAGFALTLEILDITEEILESKLNEILGNKRFINRAKELSNVWRDQPHTPLETAVFWSEYVIRHKGAKHMQSAAADLHFIQYHSIDVVVFLISIITAFTTAIFCCIKYMCRCCCKRSSAKSKQKKNLPMKKTN